MTRPRPAVLIVLSALLLPSGLFAQPRQPAPLPQGNRITAQAGDIIVLDEDAQVKILRRRDANVRVVFNRAERWLVLLVDYASKGGPDGRVDWSYNYRELSGDWPIDERWEGPSTIEEYGMASPVPASRGLGFTGPAGLIQLLNGPVGLNEFRDRNAAAVLTFQGGGAGVGGGETFEEAEARERANVRRSAQGGAQLHRFPGVATRSVEARVGVAPGQPQSVDGLAPVRVGGNVQAPEKIVHVAPVLPELAARAGVRGVVILEATIGADGLVTNARVLRSIPLLDQAAIDAVRQWRYTPTMLNGQAVPVIMTVTVRFD
jgi:protein TonB